MAPVRKLMFLLVARADQEALTLRVLHWRPAEVVQHGGEKKEETIAIPIELLDALTSLFKPQDSFLVM